MKIIEIILKLTFLVLAIYVIATGQVFGQWFMWLVYTAFILGIVLIFNKHESYGYPTNYPKMNRVFLIRRIEGVILVAGALVVFLHS
ncbi:MAG: hypothetical protein KGJ35_00040 [Patescibacteria group bacterium]|nr:hypothetical protein [Patescibacteria group bacterium]